MIAKIDQSGPDTQIAASLKIDSLVTILNGINTRLFGLSVCCFLVVKRIVLLSGCDVLRCKKN